MNLFIQWFQTLYERKAYTQHFACYDVRYFQVVKKKKKKTVGKKIFLHAPSFILLFLKIQFATLCKLSIFSLRIVVSCSNSK